MSLILEALKKSEAKRRLGAAPDLGTPFASRRRRSPIVPIIVVVLAAAALVWWAVRRPASDAPAQNATAQNTARAPTAPSSAAQRPLRSVTGDNNLQQTAPPANLAKPAMTSGSQDPFVATQPSKANDDPAARASIKEMRDRRRANANRGDNAAAPVGAGRPMPNMQRATPPSNAPAVTAAPPRPASAVVAPPATAVTPVPRPAAPVAVAPNPAQPPLPPAPTPKATDANPSAAQVTARAPKTPGTIGLPVNPPAPAQANVPAKQTPSAQPYSELPFSVRKALPELRLSMHVYTADPAQRFVVLNDSRIGEGDKTNDDVYVREIRPDGVVLEFQSQRFFYPRDGL
jgi:general secretion pathway protein B